MAPAAKRGRRGATRRQPLCATPVAPEQTQIQPNLEEIFNNSQHMTSSDLALNQLKKLYKNTVSYTPIYKLVEHFSLANQNQSINPIKLFRNFPHLRDPLETVSRSCYNQSNNRSTSEPHATFYVSSSSMFRNYLTS